MLNSDPEVPWADSCKKHDIGGDFLNAEVLQKTSKSEIHDFKNKDQCSCTSEGGTGFAGLSSRLFILTFYA